MANATISYGVLLIVLGLAGYLIPAEKSLTAFIPAMFGVAFLGFGIIATAKPEVRKHIMHAAAALSLLALIGALPGLVKMIQWGLGTPPARPAAVTAQTVMAILSVIYLVICVRSFIAARRRREAGFDVRPS